MRSLSLISHLFLGRRRSAALTCRCAARIRELDAAFNARYSRHVGVQFASLRFLRHRSVTEGLECSRRRKRERALSGFRLVDRIVPAVIVALFVLLLVSAGAFLQG
jgi:hypothetical protein